MSFVCLIIQTSAGMKFRRLGLCLEQIFSWMLGGSYKFNIFSNEVSCEFCWKWSSCGESGWWFSYAIESYVSHLKNSNDLCILKDWIGINSIMLYLLLSFQIQSMLQWPVEIQVLVLLFPGNHAVSSHCLGWLFDSFSNFSHSNDYLQFWPMDLRYKQRMHNTRFLKHD